MTRAALNRRAKEARSWLNDACFPLWAEAWDARTGLFSELQTLEHGPLETETTRVRVQARQTYVFAEALRMGWQPERAEMLVRAGLATLAGPARRGDGLVGKTMSVETGELVDDTADLYDTAFALYALAEAGQVLVGETSAIGAARAVLSDVERSMRDKLNGGYAEALPRPTTRAQNPHMHLFEALLNLHIADPQGGHLERAGDILQLFLAHFTAGPGSLLGEFFEADWSAPKGEAADIIEPGHQFEWVWLLHTHARMINAPLPPEARVLYEFAVKSCDVDGRAIQQVTRGGAVHDGSRRTWPQTEALKAHLAMLEATGSDAHAALACQSFDVLMDEYLTPEGGWIDHYAADGNILAQNMPASTGYHVVLAMAELMRVADL